MTEKRLLQITVAIVGLIPVTAGMVGGIRGTLMQGVWGDVALDSHYRYLSGLLLAIGVGFWTAIPDIERQGERFALLTLIVVTGGFFRAVGLVMTGQPGPVMTAALLVELVVTPAIYLWQTRIAHRAPSDARLATL